MRSLAVCFASRSRPLRGGVVYGARARLPKGSDVVLTIDEPVQVRRRNRGRESVAGVLSRTATGLSPNRPPGFRAERRGKALASPP